MVFWIRMDQRLAGARGDTGIIHPDALENELDRQGIRVPENRDAARMMLDFIAAGRAKALRDDIPREKKK